MSRIRHKTWLLYHTGTSTFPTSVGVTSTIVFMLLNSFMHLMLNTFLCLANKKIRNAKIPVKLD